LKQWRVTQNSFDMSMAQFGGGGGAKAGYTAHEDGVI
jgi:hypothetical protein